MARVFISYSRTDEKFARRLATDMARLGADVWIDVEDIPAGMDWSNAIQEGLDTGDVMLLILSPKSCASPNVEEEWKYFKAQGKPIIPIWLEPCKIHYQLRNLQYIDFHTQDYDPALVQLQAALKQAGIEISGAVLPSPRPTRRRTYWAVGAGMALILIGVVAIIWSSLDGDDGDEGDDQAARTPTSTLREELFSGIPFVYVAEGCFEMGRDDGKENEAPAHPVCLAAFWMGKTEVTNAQYKLCVEAGACTPPADRTDYDNPDYASYPVVHVKWDQAQAYAAWVGGHLPTEAQWEYAARGPEEWTYPWGAEDPSCEVANIKIDVAPCVGEATTAGSYPGGASWAGALDMGGNVWEWTADWYDKNYYNEVIVTGEDTNPDGPDAGDYRVIRGGSYLSKPEFLVATYRTWTNPAMARDNIGFRVVRVP